MVARWLPEMSHSQTRAHVSLTASALSNPPGQTVGSQLLYDGGDTLCYSRSHIPSHARLYLLFSADHWEPEPFRQHGLLSASPPVVSIAQHGAHPTFSA